MATTFFQCTHACLHLAIITIVTAFLLHIKTVNATSESIHVTTRGKESIYFSFVFIGEFVVAVSKGGSLVMFTLAHPKCSLGLLKCCLGLLESGLGLLVGSLGLTEFLDQCILAMCAVGEGTLCITCVNNEGAMLYLGDTYRRQI